MHAIGTAITARWLDRAKTTVFSCFAQPLNWRKNKKEFTLKSVEIAAQSNRSHLPIWPNCTSGWIIAALLQRYGRGSLRHFGWNAFAVLLLNEMCCAGAWSHINLLGWIVWLHGALVLWTPRWIHRRVRRVNLRARIQANVLSTVGIRVCLILMRVLHLLVRALLYWRTVVMLFGGM